MNFREKIILGCGNFGGIGSAPELCGRGDSPDEAYALLDLARDFGLTRFDTANSYGCGASEEILGTYLSTQSAVFRRKARVATKVGNPHGARPGEAPLSFSEIKFQLERSLFRLGVDRIDVYYVHELPDKYELHEVLEAFHGAILSGLISSFGLSNVNQKNVETFLAAAGPSLGRYLSHVQNEFHFLNPSDSESLMPFLAARNIKYSAFSPLAGGLLTGKYDFTKAPPSGSRLSLRREPYEKYLSEGQVQRTGAFVTEARSRNQTPASAALEYVLGTPGVDSAVIGPRKRTHYEDLGFK